jgi:hypothetical protein
MVSATAWAMKSATAEGCAVGDAVGAADGCAIGDAVGPAEGSAVGDAVGTADGCAVGDAAGAADGCAIGDAVGTAEGSAGPRFRMVIGLFLRGNCDEMKRFGRIKASVGKA